MKTRALDSRNAEDLQPSIMKFSDYIINREREYQFMVKSQKDLKNQELARNQPGVRSQYASAVDLKQETTPDSLENELNHQLNDIRISRATFGTAQRSGASQDLGQTSFNIDKFKATLNNVALKKRFVGKQ